MQLKPTAFYAYPSKSDHLTETIENAIRSINKRDDIHIMSWRTIRIGGKIVINEILNRIRSADLFLCDLTGLNSNVLFELGFAIALRKRVWLTLDTTKARSKDRIEALDLLSNLGYRAHTNSDDIASQFLKDRPFDDLDAHALREHETWISGITGSSASNDVFYVPSSVDSTAVRQLVRYLAVLKEQNGRKIVEYDYLENNSERLHWYLRSILEANATIVHLDDVESAGAQISNARCSLLAGMALGFDRNLLMIAPSPFDPPFDYRELLLIYKNARQCKTYVDNWLRPIFMTRIDPRPPKHDSELALLEFNIGEPTAENEELELSNYFVTTAAYSAGTRSKTGIFVGRKGTGKTANLYQLRGFYSNERTNLVVIIKPVSFRIAVFVRLLDDFFPQPELAADFIERIWRAIVYSDVAMAVCRRIKRDTRYRDPTNHERALLEHVTRYHDFVDSDFAARIDMIRDLIEESMRRGTSAKVALQTVAVKYTQPLVEAYSGIFQRFQQLVILVDNLDKAWSVDGNPAAQKQLIFGLLGFQNTIHRDLSLTKGDIRLFVFLREDIFTQVMAGADEPDKLRLGVFRVFWPHRGKLLDILERRFLACSPKLSIETIWDELFCRETAGVDTKDYLLDHVMPRPRDLIHVVHTAIDNCVGRGHLRIGPDDLQDAIKEYFQFLLANLFAEYGRYMPDLRELIRSFYGVKYRQGRFQVWRTIRPYMRSDRGFMKIVEFLFRVSFIGIERQGRVKYAYTNDEAERLIPLMWLRLRWHYSKKTYFVIHPAFRAGLEIDET